MKHFFPAIVLSLFCAAAPLLAQNSAPAANGPQTTLHVTSRAVLVDVIVSDRHGNPVTGLKQDDFRVTEQGKPQTITFFEEHKSTAQPAPVQMPQLPPDVFTNFSPFPAPPAVNVLLLDSLNTGIENQSVVHAQALKFLKTAKPGSRMAIFTMGLGLHFVQGFTDDPALLVAALDNKKNNEVQTSVMLKGQEETNAEANLVGMMSESAPAGGGTTATAASPDMIAALSNFLQENDTSRTVDRVLLTLENMQRLATFLNGFPGRKNVIWFSESFPLQVGGNVDPQLKNEMAKTMAMLAAARVALYPVDSRGVTGNTFYQAQSVLPSTTSQPSQIMGVDSNPTGTPGATQPGLQNGRVQQEDMERNSDQYTMEAVAHETGGKAFMNTNGLAQVIGEISASSDDFYTLSYSPTDTKMDGTYRKIEVKVADGKYNLSYRRGYNATDAALPGAALVTRNEAIERMAAESPGSVDPLLPFMDLGMPESDQILYKTIIRPLPAGAEPPAGDQTTAKGPLNRYSVDFAIDLGDLDLTQDNDDLHDGILIVSLIVYDRYGRIASHAEHIVALKIKPDVYAIFQKTGVQLHAEIAAPKGQFWLRTGIYDQFSHKVGTLEVPLSAVKPLEVSEKQ